MISGIVPGDESIVNRAKGVHPTTSVSAVIVTRNRIPMLRDTLNSIKDGHYPIAEIIVSDDSSDDQTAKMLSTEFPDVVYVKGPQRGISANRNRGMCFATSDFILLSDDDMLVDPAFVRLGVEKIRETNARIVFTAVRDGDRFVLPNTLGFLGFSNKPYAPGSAYNTANQQCFLIARELLKEMAYDEVIEAYGYEEMDFAYRVAAAGHHIACIPICANVHLAPNPGPPRHEKDASRIYVTFKRLAYVDKKPWKALAFLIVALPHHLISSVRRDGLQGAKNAFSHFQLARRMLVKYLQHARQSV